MRAILSGKHLSGEEQVLPSVEPDRKISFDRLFNSLQLKYNNEGRIICPLKDA
jgi:hypothetical protein